MRKTPKSTGIELIQCPTELRRNAVFLKNISPLESIEIYKAYNSPSKLDSTIKHNVLRIQKEANQLVERLAVRPIDEHDLIWLVQAIEQIKEASHSKRVVQDILRESKYALESSIDRAEYKMEKAQKLEEETIPKKCARTENGLHQWDSDELGADNEDLGLNCTGLWCSECHALISQETYQKFFSIEATTGIKSILDIPIVEPGATKEDIDKAYEKMGLSDSDREQEMEEDNKKEDLEEEEKEEIVKCDNGHKCQYESCRAGGGYYCPICDRDEDDPKICVQCWTEFEREVTDHTTLSHLKTYLSDTIESYKREDYNKGKSKFRDEIEQNIKDLEKQIKEEEKFLQLEAESKQMEETN